MIHVECPDCAKSYEVADELAGKAAKCRACGARVPIPAKTIETPKHSPVRDSNAATPPIPRQDRSSERVSTEALSQAPKSKSVPPTQPLEKPPQKKSSSWEFEEAADTNDEFTDEDFQDPFPRFSTDASQRRGKKKSKGSATLKASFGWLASSGQFIAKHAALLVFLAVVAGVVWLMFKTLRGQLANEELLAMTIIGLLVCVIADFWLSVRIWRTNPGWAATLMLCNVGLKALAKADIIPVEVIYGLEGIRSVAVIAFVVDHWGKLKTPFLVSLLGLCVFLCGLFGVGQRGMPMIARNGNPAVVPNGNPVPVFAPNPNPAIAPNRNPNPPFAPNPNPMVPQNRAVPLPAPVGEPVAAARRNAVVPLDAPELVKLEDDIPVGPFPVDTVPMPALPEFSLGPGGNGESFPDKSVTCMRHFFINAKSNVGNGSRVPGVLMKMIYFEPRGIHRPRSLPCVLVASAGTNLLHGTDCPTKEQVSETLPYVKAGFAVLGFSVDGFTVGNLGLPEERLAQTHFTMFQKACAGLVNVRNVVEFASEKIPQVDPDRLFIAGHSTAGTLALLAAAHEPRFRGAVAYAPVTDVETRLQNLLAAPESNQLFPGLRVFAKQSSPLTHIERMACPIFLFHAADDANVVVDDSRRFVDLLKSNDKTVEFVEVPKGNHYDAMLQQGIPRAIRWMRDIALRKSPTNNKQRKPALASKPPDAAKTDLPEPEIRPDATGRVLTFRFQAFAGKGDSLAAARQAFQGIAWADKNDLEIDAAKGVIRVGQLGGSVSTEEAHSALAAAGFEMLPGVSIGNKGAVVAANTPPNRPPQNDDPKPNASKSPAATIADVPEPPGKPSTKADSAKPKAKVSSPASVPPEKKPARETARRIAIFRYERYTGKGSSTTSMREALKRIDWADQDDLVLDTAKKEIRVGLLAEKPDFEAARKALTNQGFTISGSVNTTTTKD